MNARTDTVAPHRSDSAGHRTLGSSVSRHEDHRLLTGHGHFVDDVDRVGQAHVRIVRSTVAHAEIGAIDVSRALRCSGVLAVYTGADVADIPTIPIRLPRGDEPAECRQPVLARQQVRYVGEPVAVVVADDAYLAEDAAELITVDYRELSVTLKASDTDPVSTVEAEYGEVDAAFSTAAHVVELDMAVGRHAAVPLEPRGLVASYDAGDGVLQVWGATKVPVFNRDVTARMLGMPSHRVHLHAMDAGGGFGARGEFYPEDLLVPWLALQLRRPVKWTEDRGENLVALNHSRQQRHCIAAAFDTEARLLALRDEIFHDNGAYLRTHGLLVPELTVSMLPGPYRIPAYSGRIHVALTNKTPCGTYRAPGRYEGTFAREQLLDVAADRIGVARAELRRRNLLQPEELPHERPLRALDTDVVLDAGDYPGLFEMALRHTEPWHEEAARLRTQGHTVGFGFAMFLEKSGLGPHETADVLVQPDGAVWVYSGGTSLGQGIETVLAQIVAERLDLPDSRVHVVNGDTERQPFGLGSWASRSTVVAGSAVDAAASAILDRARTIAARILEVDDTEVEYVAGAFFAGGRPDRTVSLSEVAAACAPGSRSLADGEQPGLHARRVFTVDHMTYPYGVHAALVEIDPDTGGLTVLRYLVAYEVGKAVNPQLVAGQLIGGVAQGLGGAAYEAFTYDEEGQPQAATFIDYLLPTASEVPSQVETLITEDAPSPDNPLGVKGAGEGGVTAAGAAIANAVRDALRLPGCVDALPLSPDRITALAASDEA